MPATPRSRSPTHALGAIALALGLAGAPGCRCTSDADTIAVPAGAALLEPGFPWTCSPDPEVGCSGTFEVRRAADVAGALADSAMPITGREALGVRIASLKAAKRSIRIQALIFRADETGLYLSELLKQRKADGLEVRVIVDAASNLDWQTQWMYFDLKRHGIDVEGYEALYLEWLTAEKLYDPLHANKRFHDKMWVIDGEDPATGLAIVGGLNLANEYFRVDDEPLNLWRDQDVLLRGPIVQDVMVAFDRNDAFFARIKEKLPKALNPDNAWKLTEKLQRQVAAVEVPSWQDETLKASVRECASLPAGPVYTPEALRFLQSRPRSRETYILQAYLAEIGAAKTSILIANAYFIPSRPVIEALLQAGARGVEVIVLTNSPESNDIAQVATMSRHMYKRLMDETGGGVRIAEWTGPSVGEGTLHAKFALFDGTEAIIGSYNLDPRSERLNSETAIAVRDASLVGALEERFRGEMLGKARWVTWNEAVDYHDPQRLSERFELLYSLPLTGWL